MPILLAKWNDVLTMVDEKLGKKKAVELPEDWAHQLPPQRVQEKKTRKTAIETDVIPPQTTLPPFLTALSAAGDDSARAGDRRRGTLIAPLQQGIVTRRAKTRLRGLGSRRRVEPGPEGDRPFCSSAAVSSDGPLSLIA